MQINLVGGSYHNKYIAMNPRQTINYYIHKDLLQGEDSKYSQALMPFPGLSSYVNSAGTNLRGIFVAKTLTEERCFVVVDITLYELSSGGTLTSRGTLTSMTNDSSSVYMEVNGGGQLIIVHSSISYILTLATNVLTQITDVDYPSSPTSLSYTAGYFFVCAGGRVYFSDLNDGTSWTGANVFTPIGRADNTLTAVAWRDDIHCFGSETIERYLNDGSTPWSKESRSTIYIGLVSVDSLKVFDTGIIFLGKNPKGQQKVYYYNGDSCVPISPYSISWQLSNGLTGTQSAASYAEMQYSRDGHIFYYLTIPALNTTYVFDILTQEWTERQSLNPNNSTQSYFRGKWFTNFLGNNLWTDIYTGRILKEDYTIDTENGNAITRTVISNLVSNEKKFISIYQLELDTTLGVGLIATPSTAANINLYISQDGGNTYGNAITLSTGESGNYTARPVIFKLGTARDWTFKFTVTDAADLMLQAAFIHGSIGAY